MIEFVSFDGQVAEVHADHLIIIFRKVRGVTREVRRETVCGGRLWIPKRDWLEAREIARQAFAAGEIRKSRKQPALF